jgi:quercetin dioxygenase-like cupin family protein
MMTEELEVGGLRMTFLLHTTDTDGSASVFRAELKPDSLVPPPHSHDTFDETVYCEAGAIAYSVNGKPVRLTAGDALFIPRGAIHGFRPDPEQGATLVCVSTPGSDFFRAAMQFFVDTGDAPPDREALSELMRRHGVTPAVPAGVS